MAKIGGKELMKELLKNVELFTTTSFDLIDEKFSDFNFEDTLSEIFKAAKSSGDVAIEYICRHAGVTSARLEALQKQVKNYMDNNEAWQNRLDTLKKEGNHHEHHFLCSYNLDQTFCNCGLFAKLNIGD